MKKARSTKYLNRLSDIVNKVSEETGASKDEVKEVMDHFFRWLKSAITDPRMPTLKITQLGVFKPERSKIDKWIRRNFWFLRKGIIDKKEAKKRITRVWEIRSRLIQEEQGQETWRKWKNISPKNYGKAKEEENRDS